jgi:hypothetical protein
MDPACARVTGLVHPSFWTRGSAGDPESILMWFNFKVDPGLRQDDGGLAHPSFWTRGSAGDPESILMWF